MIKYITAAMFSTFSIASYSQTKISQNDFIGSWKFIELQDENGIKHNEIPMYFQGQKTVEVINRDDYTFFKNGDYKSSNKYSVGTGKWTYNEKDNTIALILRIPENDKYFKHLLESKVIKKQEDGNYYQKPVFITINSHTKNEMTIADNHPYVLIYKRL